MYYRIIIVRHICILQELTSQLWNTVTVMRNKVAITGYKITIATYKDAILRNKVTIKSDINSQLPKKKWFYRLLMASP